MVFLLLALFLIHASQAQDLKQCSYDQGPVAFCRDAEYAATDKWTLRLPINARKVLLGRMHDSELINPIEMEEKDLEDRRVLTKPWVDLLNSRECKINKSQIDFVRMVDISDQNIQNGAWYVLCTEYDVAENIRDNGRVKRIVPNVLAYTRTRRLLKNFVEDLKCVRCAVVKAEAGSDDAPKFLQNDWVEDPNVLLDGRDGVLRYTAADMPFDAVKISGVVIDQAERDQLYRFKHLIKSRQQFFIRVPQFEAGKKYAVVTDVIPQSKNGTNLVLSGIQLVLTDYLREDRVERNEPKKKGDQNGVVAVPPFQYLKFGR